MERKGYEPVPDFASRWTRRVSMDTILTDRVWRSEAKARRVPHLEYVEPIVRITSGDAGEKKL